MPDEYVETGSMWVPVTRIEYEYVDNMVLCKFCTEIGDEVLRQKQPRQFITQLKLTGWNSRSLGVAGFVLEVYSPEDAIDVEVPVMTRVPDEDVPAMYIDERPL